LKQIASTVSGPRDVEYHHPPVEVRSNIEPVRLHQTTMYEVVGAVATVFGTCKVKSTLVKVLASNVSSDMSACCLCSGKPISPCNRIVLTLEINVADPIQTCANTRPYCVVSGL